VRTAYLQVGDTSSAHRGQLTRRQGAAYLQAKDCLSADRGLQTCRLSKAYLQAEYNFPAHGGQLMSLQAEDILPPAAHRGHLTCRQRDCLLVGAEQLTCTWRIAYPHTEDSSSADKGLHICRLRTAHSRRTAYLQAEAGFLQRKTTYLHTEVSVSVS
jgi:hypothetical protein